MALNRLAGETSPYLLQHADNPVDWYPWGHEALARARSLDRPIFLSIGYSACHWCHVMERESFEDAETAALLNARFVAIKVDREERPDLDDIYMAAIQRMTGRGGWPMSVFLTPELRPFYGGTYFPADRRYGMPSFRDVLGAVSDAWRDRRDEVERSSRQLAAVLEDDLGSAAGLASGDEPAATDGRAATTGPAATTMPAASTGPAATTGPGTTAAAPGEVSDVAEAAASVGSTLTLPVHVGATAPLADPNLLDAAVASLRLSFDPVNGGWGTAPKFPQPMAIEFLLRRAVLGEDRESETMALRSLDAMAAGGVCDQLGGGFHRYATDAAWLVPHFEKMLYDNAQLARVYVHAYQLTGEGSYRDVALATLDYVRREMTVSSGAFAASQDADTDGVEGGTFVWTLDEIQALLGPWAELFAAAYGVTSTGNWEGRTILSRVLTDDELAARGGITPEAVAERLAAGRSTLLAARDLRAQPARDDKVLASWNGLMLGAFADAARAIGRPEDIQAATAAARGILGTLLGDDGRLRRSWRAGRTTIGGFLEDHAGLADGLLALYEATLDERWFASARRLMDMVLERFADPHGGFFDTADDEEQVLLRPKHLDDGATPSGNAMAATVLLRLAAWTGDARYRDAAEGALRHVIPRVARYPAAYGQWLIAIDLALEPLDEVAIVGDPDAAATRALIDVARRPFRPHQVLAVAGDPAASGIELMQSRFALQGRPTAFVCRNFACRQPVTEPAALEALLGG